MAQGEGREVTRPTASPAPAVAGRGAFSCPRATVPRLPLPPFFSLTRTHTPTLPTPAAPTRRFAFAFAFVGSHAMARD